MDLIYSNSPGYKRTWVSDQSACTYTFLVLSVTAQVFRSVFTVTDIRVLKEIFDIKYYLVVIRWSTINKQIYAFK